MKIEIEAIGYVKAVRPHAQDDFWGGEEAARRCWTSSP